MRDRSGLFKVVLHKLKLLVAVFTKFNDAWENMLYRF